jgi:hypothetical protein
LNLKSKFSKRAKTHSLHTFEPHSKHFNGLFGGAGVCVGVEGGEFLGEFLVIGSRQIKQLIYY